jgi:hypothetical protein
MARKSPKDDEYVEVVARALRVCAAYKPKFGKGKKAGLTLEQFQEVYGGDPFYNWVGLGCVKGLAVFEA